VRANCGASGLLHFVEAGLKVGLRDFAYGREDAQDIEETGRVVAALERTDGVGFWESGSDGGRDERGGEEGVGGSLGGAVHGCGGLLCCGVVFRCLVGWMGGGVEKKVGCEGVYLGRQGITDVSMA